MSGDAWKRASARNHLSMRNDGLMCRAVRKSCRATRWRHCTFLAKCARKASVLAALNCGFACLFSREAPKLFAGGDPEHEICGALPRRLWAPLPASSSHGNEHRKPARHRRPSRSATENSSEAGHGASRRNLGHRISSRSCLFFMAKACICIMKQYLRVDGECVEYECEEMARAGIEGVALASLLQPLCAGSVLRAERI